jgi:hypothetical protein
MKSEQEIVRELRDQFGKKVLENTPFPKPYFKNLVDVKAIYLGCDPSNKHSKSLKHAFALESNLPVFNKFLRDHLDNLKKVDLDWQSVYVQNICQNYFEKETSENLTLWKRVAKWWIPLLIDELKILDKQIPVLLTSAYLYDVLVIAEWKKYKPKDFYECKVDIPVPPGKNLLYRPLIPFYRYYKYHLSLQDKYRKKILKILEDKNE